MVARGMTKFEITVKFQTLAPVANSFQPGDTGSGSL
jgi:hypothetical protein